MINISLSNIKKEYLEEIINYHGLEAQILKTIEECNELSRSLSRYMNNIDSREDVQEEIADVFIMINQLAIEFQSDDIDNQVSKKLERVANNMESDNM